MTFHDNISVQWGQCPRKSHSVTMSGPSLPLPQLQLQDNAALCAPSTGSRAGLPTCPSCSGRKGLIPDVMSMFVMYQSPYPKYSEQPHIPCGDTSPHFLVLWFGDADCTRMDNLT